MELTDTLKSQITLHLINDMDNAINANKMRASHSINDSLSLTRVSAEEMDEKRQQNIAYEYLCHLEEAKKWIESCIREELPATTECEENLRNGVYLAKLSNFFCPEKVPFKKIYDKDQSKYRAHGLQFRHTDNINHWFNAMEYIGLPKIFFPETTDIYDKKNMPRVVYCLHALSLYLFKLGIAPQIQDLYGVAKFTDEEISTMARELQKYGLQLPAFSKIGGILANEMPVDEVALHAAILAINDSIEKKNLDSLLLNLKLYDAHLYNIFDEYIEFYQDCMFSAKLIKSNVAKNKLNDSTYIADVYDELLTQVEIQGYINKINVDKLLTEINKSIGEQDTDTLLRLLKSKASPFKNVIDKNIDWYLAQLTQEKETKMNVEIGISKETIQNSINIANLNSEKKNKCVKLLENLNDCITNNRKDEFVEIIKQNVEMFMAPIDYEYASSLYFIEFKYLYEEKQSNLDLEDIIHGIKVLNSVVNINKTIDSCMNSMHVNYEYKELGHGIGDENHTMTSTTSSTSSASSTSSETNGTDNNHNDIIENVLFSTSSAQFTSHSNELYFKLTDPNVHLQDIRNGDAFKRKYLNSMIAFKQFKNNNNLNSSLNERTKNNLSLSDSEDSELSTDILGCNLLTHSEIQDCISQTNAEYEQECLAVALINDSLTKDNVSHTLYLLKNSLPRDEKMIIFDQNAYVYHHEMKNHKLETETTLTIDDIKEKITKSNIILEKAINMTKTMLLLNQIDETKKSEILNLIRDKSLGITLINDAECQELYYQTFKDLKRICKTQPYVNCEYFWNKTIEDYDFYLNLKNASVYNWTMPLSFGPTPNLITRTILKKAVDATTQKYELNLLYKSKESLIILIQSLARGYLVRKSIRERMDYFRSKSSLITKIQAWWRMIIQRNSYLKRKKHFEENIKSIVKIQSIIRMWLKRKSYLERKTFFQTNEQSVIKIQSYVRSRRARCDYLSLVHDKNPSLRVVRKFVYLLEHNNTDFTEEIELQELKRQIITAIKMNKNLEQDLDMMDVKIGLLVKNRITLQDVLAQHKKLKKYKEDIELNQTNHIKQLSKENHDKMELYQNLFYLLQTNPIYLAKLLFVLPITNTSKFIETVVLQLFNYGANSREEYLLLKLFTTSLQQEIDSKVDKMSDIITGTPLVIKVIVSLYRKHRGENVLRTLLNQTIEEFLNTKNIQLCLNPCDLYKNWINKLESDTGKPSGYPYDVTNQKALEYSEVRKQLEENIKLVKIYTSKFLQLIIKSIDRLPFGLRYIAKVLRNSLKYKFTNASDREILKIIGNLIYYRFINSAICSPDMYDVIDLKAGAQLDSDQRKNLACIAKHLQLISMSKGYGDTENAHLACLNPFIKESHELIRSYFYEVCNVCEADEYFGINEYSDLIVLTKPVVYMTVQEICDTHRILVEYLDRIAPDENDPLREIFKLLHFEPNLDSLTENLCSRTSLNTSASNDTLTRSNISKNTQLCLTLTNRFTPNGDEKTDLNNLFIKTKRFIVEVIYCQTGETLMDILKTPATVQQELIHEELLKRREKNDKFINPDYNRISKSLNTTLEIMKKEVRQNLVELEKAKMVSSQNNYQTIVSRIAQDIRNQRKHRIRRQKELSHLHDVYKVLQKKHNLLKEQVSYYNEYVKACLDGFNSKKGRSKNPFKRKEEKLVGSIKYSGAKLHDKGVILEIDGLQPNQFKNVIFEISTTDEPGIFEVSAKFMGVTMEKVELIFQDLLQMQYEGASIMKMFDKAKINVNLLIFLLNKKFYGK